MAMETLPSGTILHGRYRIERVLGSGGFGHVYLANDLQTHQQYAIKEYLVTGASGKAQLEHEARVLSQLHHPSLPAFQAAFDERGRYYVVLGYIEGNDLTDYLRVVRQKNEVVPLERILTWLISICDAVTFLHNQHPPIIHRDIKPDNIRITSDGTAILVDLGNAKAAADGARTLFFIRHQGTPGYAPLEQYPGGTGTDTRSDVYALGGTLYFALTAHEPPSVSTRNQNISQHLPDLPSLQELVAQNPPESTLEANPVRQFRLGVSKPSKPAPKHSRHLAQLANLSPELLNVLNSIIVLAMAMKQKDRYQSVGEFSNDLRYVLQSLQSTPPPAPKGPPRPVDPHSTQPDLPLLFESMQNAQASSTQDASGKHSISSTSGASDLRCPRCNSPLVRPAAFCPNCGSALNFTANSSNQHGNVPFENASGNTVHESRPVSQPDVSNEPTMMYTPLQRSGASDAMQPSSRGNVASPSAQASASRRSGTDSAPMPSQPKRQSSQQQVAPRSFIPAAAKPIISGQQSMNGPAPAASNQSHPPVIIRTTDRKLFYLVIGLIIIVLLLAIALLVVNSRHAASVQLGGAAFALARHGRNYGQHSALFTTYAASFIDPGIW